MSPFPVRKVLSHITQKVHPHINPGCLIINAGNSSLPVLLYTVRILSPFFAQNASFATLFAVRYYETAKLSDHARSHLLCMHTANVLLPSALKIRSMRNNAS